VVLASVSDDEAVALVSAITIITGILFLLLAIFRMGWISQLLSKAVITGFLFGAAIEVVIGELPKLTGTSIEGSNSWQKLWDWFGTIPDTDGPTLLLGLVSLVVVVAIRFAPTTVPGALVLVVGGLVVSALFGLDDSSIALVGEVPRGFVMPELPNVDFVIENFSVIGPSALGLLLIGFSQTAGDAREFASRHRYLIDINQESVAQGMANVGSGLFQGIPVSTSLSASSLNDQSGAKTPVASLTTGILIVLALLILAPLFSELPKPVLAALIIDAVVFGMMDVAEMKRLYRVAPFDFWIAIAAIGGVIAAGVLAGVIIGVALSLVWLVYMAATPAMPVLGRKPGSQVFRSVAEHPDSETYPGLLVMRFDAALHFGSSDALADRLRELAAEAETRYHTAVIDFEGVNFIDSQGSATMADIIELAEAYGAEIRLTRVKPGVLALLRRDGVIDRLGEDRIYGNVYEAAADRMTPGADPT
jgi:high affinity sulfate transporter 1